jgi:hypothetical protein
MKYVLFKISCFLLLIVSCHGNLSPGSYEEQKMTLEQQEKQSPLLFLSTDGSYRLNFWGRYVLDGTISNTATVATYKDVVIEISFYSKTQTLLETKQYTLYEYYPPGSRKSFELKVDADPATTKLNWSIVQASSN